MAQPPTISRRLIAAFNRYVRWYLKRHFHAVRLSRADRPAVGPEEKLIVYLNHPSWWDPLIGLLVAREVLGDRDHFAPIDADALARYPFFERLGFFGVEQGAGHGMRHFLRTSRAILDRPGSALWITPQGTFADPRSRPLALKPGLGSLISRLDSAVVVPLALEYAWWEERKPEALARFGYPFRLDREWLRSPQEWTALLAKRLEETQEALAAESMVRDPRAFESLTYGGSGVGGVYDLLRRARSVLKGEQFRPGHGTIR